MVRLPFLLDAQGRFHFVDLVGDRGVWERVPNWPEPMPVLSAVGYQQERQEVILGTVEGLFSVVKVDYQPVFDVEGRRRIEVELKSDEAFILLGAEGAPIRSIDFAQADRRRLVVGIVELGEGQLGIQALLMKRKRSLLGVGQLKVDQRYDLSSLVEGVPNKVLVNASADAVVVLTEEGAVYYLVEEAGEFYLRQRFEPFGNKAVPEVASMDYLLGRVSLYLTHASGQNVLYSLYRPQENGQRLFGRTKEFPLLSGGVDGFAMSQRNKAFLLTSGQEISLRFGTTAEVRWQQMVDYEPRLAVISGKYDRLLIMDDEGRLHPYRLDDPHPEASFRSFFGKLWYEGQSEPEYAWQSSGATDDFEPKLSLIPLIFGSLKGTIFALIFALPIALLSAIYTAQFLNHRRLNHPAPTRV